MCTSQAQSFLSSVGDWIANAVQTAYRQLLETLRDILGS